MHTLTLHISPICFSPQRAILREYCWYTSVLIKCFNNKCMHSLVFIWYSDINAHIWTIWSCLASQEIPCILWNPKVHYRIHNSPPIWHSEDRASWYILIIKPRRCTYFSNLFLEYNSTCFGQVFCPSSRVQYCIHSNRYMRMSYRLCWLLASGILIPLASSQRNLYGIYLLLCMQY